MKLKTALRLSLVVNAIFVIAVGYFLATDPAPDKTPPLFIYSTNAPSAQLSSLTAAFQQ